MNYEALDELITISRKSEASKATQKKYIEQMELLLNEEGLSESAQKYLRSGFGYAGAKSLAIYIQKNTGEKRTEAITQSLSSDLIKGSDKVAAFKFGINLSAYSVMWLGEDQRLLIGLIKILPSVSKNKDKQLLKDAPRSFEKYFLDLIDDDTELPSLRAPGIKDEVVREYRQMMISILEKVSKKYSEKVRKIYTWIGASETETRYEESQKQGEAIAGGGTEKTAKEMPIEEVPNDSPKQKLASPFSSKELNSALSGLSDFADRMKATASAWDETKRTGIRAQEQVAELNRTLQSAQSRLDAELRKVEQQKTEIDQCKGLISDLQFRLSDAGRTISVNATQIAELQAEIARLNSIITVYSADKQNSQSEQLNAIASKLKAEYRDFTDVENEEMTVDLGENFRFQLQSVFRILAKAGIDVERR